MSEPAVDIRPQDLVIVRRILLAHLPPSAKVWVFGSRARGTARRGSDLDLAIDAGRTLTINEIGMLQEEFEESDLPYKVDIVDMAAVQSSFRDKINEYKRSL